MKLKLTACFIGLLALQSCSSPPPPPRAELIEPPDNPALTGGNPDPAQQSKAEDRVLANIGGQNITLGEVLPPLMASNGLDVFLLVAQRDLAAREAAEQHIIVTPQDIIAERNLTMIELKENARQMDPNGRPTTRDSDDVTPEEAQQLLARVLSEGHLTEAEFDLSLEINAYLRKIVTPAVNAKITEDGVRTKFNSEYGEKAITRYIVLNDMNGVRDAEADLAKGMAFEDVVRKDSVDPVSAPTGGEAPPFSRVDNVAQKYKDVTFALNVGEISGPTQIDNHIYLIKLVGLIPPQHAKFEDYEDSVRHDLVIEATTAAINAERRKLGQDALNSIVISDPVLRQQWDARFARKTTQLEDEAAIRKKMADDLARQRATASTQPLGMPAATQPEFEPNTDAGGTTPTATSAAPAAPAAPATTPAGAAPQ